MPDSPAPESSLPGPLAVLEHASVGAPVTRVGVSLFPVFLFQPRQLSVITSRPAALEIKEVEDESVPTLTVTSVVDDPVLMVEGETVAGGLQQRALNVSVLVAPREQVDVPVSCVEAGRWGGSRDFSGASGQTSRRVRRAKTDSLARNVASTGRKSSDQGAVWDSVDRELDRLMLASPTRNFADSDALFDRDEELGTALGELVRMGPLPGQCGVVTAHGSRVVSAEVFAGHDVLAAQWEPTVRAALVDAPSRLRGRPSASRALRFLRRFSAGAAVEADGVGMGRERHVRTSRLVGQVLTFEEMVVHASAFALAA